MAHITHSSPNVLTEIIDRILDKGLVVDIWARVLLVGVEVLTIEARVVVASVQTYLTYADAIGQTRMAALPRDGELARTETLATASYETVLETAR